MATLSDILEQMRSGDKNIRFSAHEKLSEIGGNNPQFYILLLELDNTYNLVRNHAALCLADIGDSIAVQPLLKAILKKENIHYNGTLVYALKSLDCSRYILQLFQILMYHGYEAKMSACHILSEQEFKFTQQDILEIKSMWKDLLLHPKKCPAFDDSRLMIEDAVEGYMSYIEDKMV